LTSAVAIAIDQSGAADNTDGPIHVDFTLPATGYQTSIAMEPGQTERT